MGNASSVDKIHLRLCGRPGNGYRESAKPEMPVRPRWHAGGVFDGIHALPGGRGVAANKERD